MDKTWRIILNDYEDIELTNVMLNSVITLHNEVESEQAGIDLVNKIHEAQLEEFTLFKMDGNIKLEMVEGERVGYQVTQVPVGTEKRWFADIYIKAKSAPDLVEAVLNIDEQGVGPLA